MTAQCAKRQAGVGAGSGWEKAENKAEEGSTLERLALFPQGPGAWRGSQRRGWPSQQSLTQMWPFRPGDQRAGARRDSQPCVRVGTSFHRQETGG